MMATRDDAQSRFSLRRVLPIVEWLPKYDRSWLRFDLIAALSVAAVTLPICMAYAGLAGLPPEAGLYASMVALIAYGIFGSSRQLSIGPGSALSILVASALSVIAAGNAERYAELAALLALMVGVISVIAWLLKLGFIVNFISQSVLLGFSAGSALFIASTQLGKLFGIHGSSGEFFEQVGYIIRHLSETNGWTLAVGLAGIVILVIGQHVAPKLPWSLIVVLLSILLVATTDLAERGVEITGEIPRGLPAPSIPSIGRGDLRALLPTAMAIFLLAYVEGIGAAETFAKRHQDRIDPDQELLALGASSVSAGLFQSFVVGGSLTRTTVNDTAGARTPLASLGSGVLLGIVILFLTGLFYNLPQPILASVVIVAVSGLFDIPAMRRLWRLSRQEFAIAATAFAGVLFFGMLEGVLIGAVLSIVILVYRASQLETVELARAPNSDHFANAERHPENELLPNVVVYRVHGGVFYVNVKKVRDDLERLIDQRTPAPKLVVFDLSASPAIDLASAEMLGDLHDELGERGIELRLAEVGWPVRDALRDFDVAARFGELGPNQSIASVIEQWNVNRNRGQDPADRDRAHPVASID
jgi:high affinity sulfate transporter 1